MGQYDVKPYLNVSIQPNNSILMDHVHSRFFILSLNSDTLP